MDNMKALNPEELENVNGGLLPGFLPPGMGTPQYPVEKDEPRDGGATGSW